MAISAFDREEKWESDSRDDTWFKWEQETNGKNISRGVDNTLTCVKPASGKCKKKKKIIPTRLIK